MISIISTVHNNRFKWQTDLFWFNHKLTYGKNAAKKAMAAVVKRNLPNERKHHSLKWDLDIPHEMCESLFDYLPPESLIQHPLRLNLTLNIQVGLAQILPRFNDEQIIEVLDCDLFHFKQHPKMLVRDDELYVSDVYENWHLRSLTTHRNVIERYFENGGNYYNGGFVPIIGKVRTFKKIMTDWIALHCDILKGDMKGDWPEETMKWWAGMFALQAACEKAKVQMVAKDYCYIPGIYEIAPTHYIAHYCCDSRFDKVRFPDVDRSSFEANEFYARILRWLCRAKPSVGPNPGGRRNRNSLAIAGT